MSAYETTYPTGFAATTTGMTAGAEQIVSGHQDADRLWIERARGGDSAAFERLYRAHVGRVFALCLRLLSNRSAAEEATQDAFLRAWKRLASFRGDSAFGSWLYRLAANVSIDRLRRDRRRGFADGPAEVLGESQDPDGAPAAAQLGPQRTLAAAATPTTLDLERAIRRLPPRARLVFVLHDVEGYRHGEIAALAAMAEGTSKAQLHRARKLLREMLTR